jgi:hypothetical protein
MTRPYFVFTDFNIIWTGYQSLCVCITRKGVLRILMLMPMVIKRIRVLIGLTSCSLLCPVLSLIHV